MKISIPGKLFSDPEQSSSDDTFLKLVYSIHVASGTRASTEVEEVQVDKDDLVELVFTDGTKWLCSPTTLDQFYPNGNQKSRDGSDVFRIDPEIEQGDGSRGWIGKVVLKIVNIFSKDAVKHSIRELAEALEKKQMDGFAGLVRITPDFQLSIPVTIAADKPCLIFIHGTNSSTTGSFADLLGTKLWDYALKTYGDNIYGFQHETLTKGPLQNTLELVKQLPANSNATILTFSRGGLVGDIIARFSDKNGANAGFNGDELNYLKKEGRDDDILQIKAIQNELVNKKISINKFIRIASPSAGTIVLSKRIDHFFNISLNLLGTIPLLANPIYQTMKELLVAVIDQKNDVNTLPGLEAMNPDSPIITLLNNQQGSENLSVPIFSISGNCRLNFSLKALLVITSKLFYFEDNDLVVNTKSMYAGAARKEKLQFLFDEGSDVDHFHYFSNEKTIIGILAAMEFSGPGLAKNFSQYDRGLSAASRNALLNLEGGEYATAEPSGKRPMVLLLPGIMGSCLRTDGQLTWIKYLRFLTGGLRRISIDTRDVTSSAIVETSYKELGEALGKEYDVVTFPFDWRLSLKESAVKFAKRIEELLALNQPIKIIGHSMGGVLVRDFMVYHPEIWKKLNDSKDFRLLFLGAPLGGSFRILNVLFGEDDLIKKLSKIDLFHSKKELLAFFSKFPGVLSLLPLNEEPDHDFANQALWVKIRNAFGDSSWPLPGDDLFDFEKHRTKVLGSKDIDFRNAVYIAGKDAHTPCGYRIDETSKGDELVLLSTGEGDQSVTWASGIPKQMIADDNVYYCNHSHGALSCTPALFEAIKDIIKIGKTSLITKVRPKLRSSETVFRRPESSDLDISPQGIQNTILGITPREESPELQPVLKVKVVHSDLRYAKYPVLAGHFKNDGILYAEATIDRLLNWRLSEQQGLGIYPSDVGTHELMLRKGNFKGAIIVGLGEPGKLTSFELIRTVEQGVVKYLLEWNDTENVPVVNQELGISSLVIGCGYGGLSVENSIQAILAGVINANRKIRTLFKERGLLVEQIEFIELYEDTALSCLHAAKRQMKNMSSVFQISVDQASLIKKGGFRRRLNIDQTAEWWTRITITTIEAQQDSPAGLRFSISTGAAREDVRDNFVELKSIEQLIIKSSETSKWDRESAKAIFELLIPIDFKARMKKHGNIIWVLDKNTSGFPWELLLDNSKDAKPLSINSGMIRQLATGDTRLNIEPVSQNRALVVGEPDLKGFLPSLPGAVAEAESVAALLVKNGYTSDLLIHRSTEEIIPALICANYKIMHLAGHGVFGDGIHQMTGMVLGEDSYLTMAHIKQMSITPELVFINCCYLGKIKGVSEEFYQSRYKLAANLGTQMIEIGVKCVVAAGWAVNDAGALAFSQRFYQNMFEGKPFGEAVREARAHLFDTYADDNTWAAYQCYGDPHYKLVEIGYQEKEKDYLISEQAEIDLQNLISGLEMGDFKDEDALHELNSVTQEVDRKGLRNQQITELEAAIYIALNQFEEAIRKFQDLLASEDSTYSLKSLEQYLNIRAKVLFLKVRENSTVLENLDQDFDSLTADLKAMITIAPSAERYNLLGSLFKGQATINAKKKSKNLIEQAQQSYEMAYQRRKSIYSFSNSLILKYILQIDAKVKTEFAESKEIDRLLDLIQEGISNGKEDAGWIEKEEYWDRVGQANLLFCKWVLNIEYPDLERDAKLAKVIDLYKRIWSTRGNKNQKRTEVDHVDNLIILISKMKSDHPILTFLEGLKAELTTEINPLG